MPQWQGHLCENPHLNHLEHIQAQSPWCIRDFKLPMGLIEKDLQLDPATITGFETGRVNPGDIACELVDWAPDEIATVYECAYRLTEHAGQDWVDAVEGRTISDYLLMAIDTAMIWVRG